MGRQVRLIILVASALILLLFAIFVANQTVQFVGMISSINPTAGQASLVVLLVIYAILVGTPVLLFARLPRALTPPSGQDPSELAAYRRKLQSRLSSNSLLTGRDLAAEGEDSLESALKVLDTHSNRIIKRTASAVFVSTAVSQSGRLDGIMVLTAQSRMVWQLAHVYNQRPALRDMMRLYTNVALTTFASVQIEDLDLSEQVSNVIGPAVAASSVGAVPGIGAVASVLTAAMVDGSANAFLTVRVGIIARRLCSSPYSAERSVLRRLASAEAAAMFGAILAESSSVVSRAIMGAASRAGRSAFSRSIEATKGALNAALGIASQPQVPRPAPPASAATHLPSETGEPPGRPARRPRPRWGNARNG